MTDLTPPQRAAQDYIMRTVQDEVARAMAPHRDTLQRMNGAIDQLQRTQRGQVEKTDDLSDAVFGNPRIRTMGIAERLDKMDTNITTLIKERDNIVAEIRGARRLIYVIGALITLPALQVLGWLQPLLHALGSGL